MAQLTERELRDAETRGSAFRESQPSAVSARYDNGRVVIELSNGCVYGFPVHLVQDLQSAGDENLAEIVIDGAGYNLHWPSLDVDLFLPALVSGIFGTRRWMTTELARVAGRSTSLAKADAARRNGAKGGRPRKSAA